MAEVTLKPRVAQKLLKGRPNGSKLNGPPALLLGDAPSRAEKRLPACEKPTSRERAEGGAQKELAGGVAGLAEEGAQRNDCQHG